MEVKAVYNSPASSAKKMRDAVKKFIVRSGDRHPVLHPKKGAYLLNKTLNSAVANAENNAELLRDASSSSLSWLTVHYVPYHVSRARGSANMIRKRTSHITVVLADQEG